MPKGSMPKGSMPKGRCQKVDAKRGMPKSRCQKGSMPKSRMPKYREAIFFCQIIAGKNVIPARGAWNLNKTSLA